MRLNLYRDKIDAIDRKLVNLLARREKIVKKIALVKQKKKIPLTDSSRERVLWKLILEHAGKVALDKKFIKNIFALILKQAKKVQAEIGK